MQFSIKAVSPATAKTACVIAGVYQDHTLTHAAKALDQASGGALRQALKNGDLSGKKGSALLLHGLNAQTARVLLVGLGKDKTLSDKTYLDAVRAGWKALSATGAADALWCLHEVPVSGRDLAWKVRSTAVNIEEAQYRFDHLKSSSDAEPEKLKSLALVVDKLQLKAAQTALQQALAEAHGVALTRDLGNLPSNLCTPTHLAATAKELAKQFKLKVQVLEKKQMEALKMFSLLSVAKGSVQPPKFIVLAYNGGTANGRTAKQAPVVLVGKGITFDSGGISLKPGEGMDEMKYDMCGAATVLGTLRAVAEMQLPLNVIGVIPTCENMPNGNASKPGDIVTSMSGQTIEILNTDAEGRLILCDALTYVERFKPAAVIDIATLTGACIIALGHVHSGLYSKDDALAAALLKAGKAANDTVWQMPLDDDYQEQLKSNFADMANIGGRPGGSVTAACFLSRFTKAYTWAHLDIAGTAWKSGAAKGATGRPVPLLVEFLKSYKP
ncbi:MAG: leucyl aminopeptidase [Burkholderiaceae bacterium]|nr:MAG: leucyl aminopeptidase [Burkholderiaceae bacterium]